MSSSSTASNVRRTIERRTAARFPWIPVHVILVPLLSVPFLRDTRCSLRLLRVPPFQVKVAR